tara:strand:- start:2449 stop:5310 length:2862 start_codon:yes stop_codon:yes gene_type:complete
MNKEKILEMFESISYVIVQSLEEKDQTEEKIEAELFYEAKNNERFSSLSEKDIKSIVRNILITVGVQMNLATCIKDIETDFEEWLNEDRKENTERRYSQRYERLLLEQKRFSKTTVLRQRENVELVLSNCGDPLNKKAWDRKGMVVGSVQSGKTSNYIGLINEAVDHGYKIIIVIAGNNENLRSQTQKRINEGFIGEEKNMKNLRNSKVGVGLYSDKSIKPPFTFTYNEYDFDFDQARKAAFKIEKSLNRPVVFVIKKNKDILKNLLNWFKSSPALIGEERIKMPLLLIDDEADNASINTASQKKRKENSANITMINKQIRQILELFLTKSYIGYTATPFANIFIDPDSDDEMYGRDLFPRDFIVGLEPPSNYFGPESIFNDQNTNDENTEAYEFLESIWDNEDYIPIKHKIDFEPLLPPSLKKAIRAFFIANAVKDQKGIFEKNDSSMMINVTRFTKVQNKLKFEVLELVEIIKSAIRTHCGFKDDLDEEILNLRNVYQSTFRDQDFSWEQIKKSLLKTYSRTIVKEINSFSPDTLKYKNKNNPPISPIVIGGFSLSRGLTLEGLTISYFLRKSTMYDTNLQMGRWFGYREGYRDLCKIWMRDEEIGTFSHITRAIGELKQELINLARSKLSPYYFGLKVRNHPDSMLMITARNKIGKGKKLKISVDFTGKFIGSWDIPKEKEVLKNNFKITENLMDFCLKESRQDLKVTSIYNQSGVLIKNINKDKIKDYLNSFVASNIQASKGPLLKYISKREENELNNWDVFLNIPIKTKDTLRNLPRRKIKLNDKEISPGHRTLRFLGSNKKILRLTSNNKISGPLVGKIGLSEEVINTVEKEFIKDNPSKSKKINPFIYCTKNRNPLIILFLIDIFEDHIEKRWDEKEKKYKRKVTDSRFCSEFIDEDKCITAWEILFPDSNSRETTIEYIVNAPYQREYIDNYNYNDEDDDDDDDF